MTIGIDDVAAIHAGAMIPVYKSQVDHYKRRLVRLSLQKAVSGESSFDIYIRSAELGLRAAELDLAVARKVVMNYDRKRQAQSTSFQDAATVVSDQGQSEGTTVQTGQETLSDTDQGA